METDAGDDGAVCRKEKKLQKKRNFPVLLVMFGLKLEFQYINMKNQCIRIHLVVSYKILAVHTTTPLFAFAHICLRGSSELRLQQREGAFVVLSVLSASRFLKRRLGERGQMGH